MSQLIVILAILSLLSTVSFACKCRFAPTNEAFCGSDWVSHVKVQNVITTEEDDLPKVKITVQHLDVFKKPSNLTALPDEIHTPSHSAACGVTVSNGEEYLLSGSFDGTILFSASCGQVLPGLDWKTTSQEFKDEIKTIKC